ncbi:hypothetical protein ACN3XK_52065 [Actinomadura welshii]
MNDELDALLRVHYREAADDVHAGPDTVRRFQEAGRAAAAVRSRPARTLLRRWSLPALAAAVTAAVLVAMAVFGWQGGREPDGPRPLAPPVSPAPEGSSPPPTGGAPTPSVVPTVQNPGERPQGPSGGTGPAPSVKPKPVESP